MKFNINGVQKYTRQFKVQITSWENDGDHYNTTTHMFEDYNTPLNSGGYKDIEGMEELINTLDFLNEALPDSTYKYTLYYKVAEELYDNDKNWNEQDDKYMNSKEVEFIDMYQDLVGMSYESDYPRTLEEYVVTYYDSRGVEHDVIIGN